MNHFWRLSEAEPDNLGLACTDEGLLLGHTSLIERRGGRFVVRERNEIDRLLKRTYNGEPPVDRLMSRLATVARALSTPTISVWCGSRPCIWKFPICQARPRATRWRPKIC